MELLKLLNDDNIPEEELKNYKHRNAVRIIIYDEKNQIAVVHARINEYYELPGGGVEQDETLKEGAVREAKEEAGCDVRITERIGIIKEYLLDKKLINETFCFKAIVVGNKYQLKLNQDEIDEGMDIIWVDIEEAVRLINTNRNESKFATPQQIKYTKVRDLTFLEKVKQTVSTSTNSQ